MIQQELDRILRASEAFHWVVFNDQVGIAEFFASEEVLKKMISYMPTYMKKNSLRRTERKEFEK